MAQHPITKSTLKTAEPTMAAKPTFDFVRNVPIKDIASSGADPPLNAMTSSVERISAAGTREQQAAAAIGH